MSSKLTQPIRSGRRGEIATSLAVFSVMVVTLGLALGSNLLQQNQGTSTSAQSSAYIMEQIPNNEFNVNLREPAPAGLWDYMVRGTMCFNFVPPNNAQYKMQLVAEAEGGEEEKVLGFSNHRLTLPFQSQCGRRGEDVRMVFNLPDGNPCPNVRIEFLPFGRGTIGSGIQWARAPIVVGHMRRSFFPGCTDNPTVTPSTGGGTNTTPIPTTDPNTATPTPIGGGSTVTPPPGTTVTPLPTTPPIRPRAYSCELDGGLLRGAIDIVGTIPTDSAGRPLFLKVAACVVLDNGDVRCANTPDSQGREGGIYAENTVQVNRLYPIIKPIYVLRGLPLNKRYGVFVYPELFDRNGNVALDSNNNPIRINPYNAQAIDCRATSGSIRKEYDQRSQAVCHITFADPQSAPQCRSRQDFRITFAGGSSPVSTIAVPTGVPTVAVPTGVPTVALPSQAPTVANKKLNVRVNVDGTLRADYDRFTYWVEVCDENGCVGTPPADKTSGVIDVPGDRNGVIAHRQNHAFENAYANNKVTLFYKYRRNDGRYNVTAVEIVHNNNTKCTDELFAPGSNSCKFAVTGNEGTLEYNVKLPDPQSKTYELAYGVENNATYPIIQTLIPYCSISVDNNGKSHNNTDQNRLPADEKVCAAMVAQQPGTTTPDKLIATLNFYKRAGISPLFMNPAFWELRVCPGEAGPTNRATANETQVCTRNTLLNISEEVQNYFQSPVFNVAVGSTLSCTVQNSNVPTNLTQDGANRAVVCKTVEGFPPIGGPGGGTTPPVVNPTAIPTVALPSGTQPTAIPTVSVPNPPLDQVACIYDSKARVEVCDAADPSQDPNCVNSSALKDATLDTANWGILNNKQVVLTPAPEKGKFRLVAATGNSPEEVSSKYYEKFLAPGKTDVVGCIPENDAELSAATFRTVKTQPVQSGSTMRVDQYFTAPYSGSLTRLELPGTLTGGRISVGIEDAKTSGSQELFPRFESDSTNITLNSPVTLLYGNTYVISIEHTGAGEFQWKHKNSDNCVHGGTLLYENAQKYTTATTGDQYFKLTMIDKGIGGGAFNVGETTAVTLFNPDTYQVVSNFCKLSDLDASGNVIRENDCVAASGSGLNTVSGIALACNRKYDFGWKLRRCFAPGTRVVSEGCGPFSAQQSIVPGNVFKGQTFVAGQSGVINKIYVPGVLSQDGRVSLTVFKMADGGNTVPEASLGGTAIYDRATETFNFGGNGVTVEQGKLYAIALRVVSGSYLWNYSNSASCYPGSTLGAPMTITDNGNGNFSFAADSVDFNFRVDIEPVNLCQQQTALLQAILKNSDINEDGIVNLADMEELIEQLNMEGKGLAGDLDGNGRVDAIDITLLLGNLYVEN